MKKKKLKKAPHYLKRDMKEDSNMAFFKSPYFKYVIAGTAVIVIAIILAQASSIVIHVTSQVLGASTGGR